MAEQERQETTEEQAPAQAAGAVAAEAPPERKSTLAERAAAPAGPPTAVLAPRAEPGTPKVSRRGILRLGFWTALGTVLAGLAGCGVDMLYPRGVTGFGGRVSAGDVSQFPAGSKTPIPEGRFWLVHLTEDQGGPGLLALYWRCPHLGCTVPWRPTFVWPDPDTGADKQGWFRCPCHGSTYTDAGVRVYGPAPRSMDVMTLTVENGRISVNTSPGAITSGTPSNADLAIRV